MTHIIIVLCAMFFVALNAGCVQTVADVTRTPTLQYASIAAKTYVTQADLFLVKDRRRKRAYLFAPDAQYFPYSPAEFTGAEIRVAWGGKSFITDVIGKGTTVIVARIENVAGFDMVYDRIYGKFLNGMHAGEIVQIEHLFHQSDRAGTPTVPRVECLREGGQ